MADLAHNPDIASRSNPDIVDIFGIPIPVSPRSTGGESTNTIFEVGKSILNFAGDVVPSLYTEDNITSLMSQLDEEENLNLFDIVKFLNLYDSSNTSNTVRSQEAYKNAIASYGELISKINHNDYREVRNKRDNIHIKFNLEHIHKIPHHSQMIDNINQLSSSRQKEVKYLAWYILYCKIYKLDINDPKRITPI